MKVRLLLFAHYKDAAGTSELSLDVSAGSNALAAVTQLRGTTPQIPERPVIAINQVYASLDDILQDGDELALLPPVAGG